MFDKSEDKSGVILSPVRLIIDQCIQIFNLIFNSTSVLPLELVTKVCDVLKAGLLSLHIYAASLLETYVNYLDVFFCYYPNPACLLAKTLFLVNSIKKKFNLLYNKLI